MFRDLAEELAPGDLVVVNTSATMAAEADAISSAHGPSSSTSRPASTTARSGRAADGSRRARGVLDAEPGETSASTAHAHPAPPYPHERSSPTGLGNRLWRALVERRPPATLGRSGRPIAYGYLDARYPLTDYQTVFGIDPGSAEMPSAAGRSPPTW